MDMRNSFRQVAIYVEGRIIQQWHAHKAGVLWQIVFEYAWVDETPRIIRGVLRIARPSIRSGTFMTSIPAKSILLRYRFFVPSQPESLHERNDLPGRLRRINVGRDPRFGHQVPGFGRKKGASL
jgi:hypothetical protein